MQCIIMLDFSYIRIVSENIIGCFTYLCPLCESFGLAVPGNLYADWVTLHSVKVGVICRCGVEKLPPQ